jgi:hypothetical protein
MAYTSILVQVSDSAKLDKILNILGAGAGPSTNEAGLGTLSPVEHAIIAFVKEQSSCNMDEIVRAFAKDYQGIHRSRRTLRDDVKYLGECDILRIHHVSKTKLRIVFNENSLFMRLCRDLDDFEAEIFKFVDKVEAALDSSKPKAGYGIDACSGAFNTFVELLLKQAFLTWPSLADNRTLVNRLSNVLFTRLVTINARLKMRFDKYLAEHDTGPSIPDVARIRNNFAYTIELHPGWSRQAESVSAVMGRMFEAFPLEVRYTLGTIRIAGARLDEGVKRVKYPVSDQEVREIARRGGSVTLDEFKAIRKALRKREVTGK